MGKRPLAFVSCILCVVLLLSLAACGKAADSSSTSEPSAAAPSSSSADTQAAAKDPLGKYASTVVLTSVRSLDSTVKFDESNPLCKSLEENQWQSAYKEYLNVDVDYIWTATPDQYNTRWNTSIAAGNLPDAAVVDSTIYAQLIEAGLVEDMTGYYNDYASDSYKQWNENDNKATLSFMTFDGKLYGLPVTGTQPDAGSMLYIRSDWLEKIGKPLPATMDELIAAAQGFMDNKLGGDKTYGIFADKNIFEDNSANSLEGFMNGFGAYYNIWVDDGSGKLVYSSIQPAMKPALLKLQELYKKGILAQDFVTKIDDKDIGAGQVGITYGRFFTPLGGMMTSIDKENAEWKVMIPPTADGSPYRMQGKSAPNNFIFVKKGYAHPEAVVKVVNLGVKVNAEQWRMSVNGMDPDKLFDETQEIINQGIYTYLFMFALVDPPWKNLKDYELCSNALVTGDTGPDLDKGVAARNYYNAIKKNDTSGKTYDLIFGSDSAFKVIKDLKESDRILVDADQTLQTKTQLSSGVTIKTALDSAMFKVIMGEDISVFDKAIEAWKQGGGDAITQELNTWYASKK